MNQTLKNRCDLLTQNIRILTDYRSGRPSLPTLAYDIPAALFLKNQIADRKAMLHCEVMYQKYTHYSISLHKYAEELFYAKMLASGDPEQYMKEIWAIGNSIGGGNYSLYTAMLIQEYKAWIPPDIMAARIKELRAVMGKVHPFLVGTEDYPFMALVILSGRPQEQLLEEAENCYERLKKVLKQKDYLQSMCHVLAFDTRSADVKCNHVMELYEALRRRGKDPANYNLITLGALQTLGLETETLVSLVIEVMDYLGAQDVFQPALYGLFSFEAIILLCAGALIVDEYTKGEKWSIVQYMMLFAGLRCADYRMRLD